MLHRFTIAPVGGVGDIEVIGTVVEVCVGMATTPLPPTTTSRIPPTTDTGRASASPTVAVGTSTVAVTIAAISIGDMAAGSNRFM